MKISASFLSSKKKAKDISKLNVTTIDYIHVDFMDGKFVEQKTLPFREMKKIYKYTSKRLDVHLMAIKPAKLIKKFASLNTEFITIHCELNENIHKYINLIHKYGIKAGLAISPDTDINVLNDYLDEIDLILVMSVYPGLGGQEFIESSVEKVKNIRSMLNSLGKNNVLVSIDGGINEETMKLVYDDVDILVSGNYITSNGNFQEAIDILKGIKEPKKLSPLELKDSLENIGDDVKNSNDINNKIIKPMTVDDLMKPMDNNIEEKKVDDQSDGENNTQENDKELTYEELLKNMSKGIDN